MSWKARYKKSRSRSSENHSSTRCGKCSRMNDETSIHDFKKVGNTYFTSNQKRGRSSMSDIDCRHWIRGKCTYHNCLFRHDPAQRGRLINERHKEKSDYFDSKESNLYSAPYSSCSI